MVKRRITGWTVLKAFGLLLAAGAAWTAWLNRPPPAILLGSSTDERIKARFPVGTPVDELGEELSRQGFQVRQRASRGMAGVDRYRWLVCAGRWEVYWTNDESGRLQTIEAFDKTACP